MSEIAFATACWCHPRTGTPPRTGGPITVCQRLGTLHGDAPIYHETVTGLGDDERLRRTMLRPVATDDRRAVLIGCGIWLFALIATVLLRDDLHSTGRGWWVWVCVAGLVLGTLGVGYLHSHGKWKGSRIRR